MWMPRHEPRATRKIRLLEITNFYRQKDGHEQRPAQYWETKGICCLGIDEIEDVRFGAQLRRQQI